MSFSWHWTTTFQTLGHDPLAGLKVNIIGRDWHLKNEIEKEKKDRLPCRTQPKQGETEQTKENPVCLAQEGQNFCIDGVNR